MKNYHWYRNGTRLLKNQTLVLYCERGGTSLMIARMLSGKGYRVKTMIGGIHAYKGRNLESYTGTKEKGLSTDKH